MGLLETEICLASGCICALAELLYQSSITQTFMPMCQQVYCCSMRLNVAAGLRPDKGPTVLIRGYAYLATNQEQAVKVWGVYYAAFDIMSDSMQRTAHQLSCLSTDWIIIIEHATVQPAVLLVPKAGCASSQQQQRGISCHFTYSPNHRKPSEKCKL